MHGWMYTAMSRYQATPRHATKAPHTHHTRTHHTRTPAHATHAHKSNATPHHTVPALTVVVFGAGTVRRQLFRIDSWEVCTLWIDVAAPGTFCAFRSVAVHAARRVAAGTVRVNKAVCALELLGALTVEECGEFGPGRSLTGHGRCVDAVVCTNAGEL